MQDCTLAVLQDWRLKLFNWTSSWVCLMRLFIGTIWINYIHDIKYKPHLSGNTHALLNALYIHLTDSAKFTTGVLGQDITLSCPLLNNGVVTSVTGLSFKDWYRGSVPSPEAMVARMTTMGSHVFENFTVVSRMWINSKDGDLIIQNLRLDDAGFYTCSSTGSEAQTIELHVIVGMFE